MTDLTDEQLRLSAMTHQLLDELLALRARCAKLEAENKALREGQIEALAELIYLGQYGKDGAVWYANESKDVWLDKARALLQDNPK